MVPLKVIAMPSPNDRLRPTRGTSRRNDRGDVEALDEGQLLTVLSAVRRGDFSARMPSDHLGRAGKVADTLNDVVELTQRMAGELQRLSKVVGKEGRISQRASLGGAAGSWADCIDSVNSLVTDLVQPTTEVARVIGAVAKGDLGQTMLLEIDGRPLRGEFLRIGKVVNTMVGQLEIGRAHV